MLVRENLRFCSFSQKFLREYLRVKSVVTLRQFQPSRKSCSLFTFDVSIYNKYQQLCEWDNNLFYIFVVSSKFCKNYRIFFFLKLV